MNSSTDGFITNIPMTFKKRSGKAIIVLPNGEKFTTFSWEKTDLVDALKAKLA